MREALLFAVDADEVERFAAFDFGVLGKEVRDQRLQAAVVFPVLEVLFGHVEVVNQHLLGLGEALAVGFQHVFGQVVSRREARVVLLHGLFVLGIHDELAAIAGVAALVAERGLVDQKHSGSLFGRIARGHRARAAEADHHDVVFAVPLNRVGVGHAVFGSAAAGAGAFRSATCKRPCACHGGKADDGAFEEVSA